LLVNWLAKIADHSVTQSTGSVHIASMGGYKNRRNQVPLLHKMTTELEPGHHRHVHVGDQAGGLPEKGRCEKFSPRRERFAPVAQRPHEPSHGLAKRLIVIDDRDYRLV